jgi:hypothetical protein
VAGEQSGSPTPASRPRLSRAEQRFNYALAAAAVTVVVAAIVVSPHLVLANLEVPVVALGLLAAAFLFGLGQMAVGLDRRRRYLRRLREGRSPAGGPPAH